MTKLDMSIYEFSASAQSANTCSLGKNVIAKATHVQMLDGANKEFDKFGSM